MGSAVIFVWNTWERKLRILEWFLTSPLLPAFAPYDGGGVGGGGGGGEDAYHVYKGSNHDI